MKCGRVDIKSAPYDTIQLKRTPSWLGKDCSQFGPPLFSSSNGTHVPLSSILPHVQLEAILWGLGTALGELPPYFISRAGKNNWTSICPWSATHFSKQVLINNLPWKSVWNFGNLFSIAFQKRLLVYPIGYKISSTAFNIWHEVLNLAAVSLYNYYYLKEWQLTAWTCAVRLSVHAIYQLVLDVFYLHISTELYHTLFNFFCACTSYAIFYTFKCIRFFLWAKNISIFINMLISLHTLLQHAFQEVV